ncbi:MAG TPA: hypothetical protein VGR37_17490 [Longimicrobiaceae bacterium]|nr:hypothetical protein [Longimicrobiaceae bacterium]
MKPIRSTSTLLLLPLVALVALSGCEAGAEAPPTPDAISTGVAAEAGPALAEPSSEDTYEVTIGSGPFAGKYRGADEMNCIIEDEEWAADFDAERDRGVSAVQVMLQGVTKAGGTTEDVHLSVLFGRPDETGGGLGGVGLSSAAGATARATAKREGADAVMRIEGRTSYGAAVTAMIRCRSVD